VSDETIRISAADINWGTSRSSLSPAPPVQRRRSNGSGSVAAPTTTRHNFNLTDAGNAEYFAAADGPVVRYDHRRGRWLIWQGDEHRWKPDINGSVLRRAKDAMRRRLVDATTLIDPDARARLAKWATASESRTRLEACLYLARAEDPIADSGSWDSDPMLIGAPNGVIDLGHGILRPGRPEDRITMSVAVPFDPDARSGLWEQTLREVLVDENVIDFVQTAAGYSMTGDTRQDCWFLGSGDGRNGKGTVLHPIRRVLGDYAMELPASVFDQRRDGTPYDLAALPGKRFVMSSESGDTIKLNHDRIKQISGGDPIRAANKYERSFEFEPACKLWLSCNREPRVNDDTVAFWARVRMVPFPVSFAGREDRNLRPTLEHDPEHQAAVLAWLVRGAVRYYAEGLTSPAAVISATDAYAHESDVLAEFIDEAIELDPDSEVTAGELFEHYARWAKDRGMGERERVTSTFFGRRMGERFASRKVHGRKAYIGLARRSSWT
jgi:putative DNA primase/helicase